MAITLEIVSKEFIKPLSPTPNNSKHHALSFFDQTHLRSYVPRIFFYGMPSCSPKIDRFQISQQLKQSLSDVLTKYYLLAGRINEDDLFVDCNDSGALFVEAEVDASLSQAIQGSIKLEELDHFWPIKPYAVCDVTNRDILLAVQINFFKCGGIAIGVSISHMVADLMSFVTFVNAWAATCRGQTELILHPVFDFGHHYFPPIQVPNYFSKEINVEKGPMLEKVVAKRFVFNKKMLAELKALASSAEVKDATRVEVVSAFIYKNLMEIMYRSKVNPKKMFSFSHSVNLRPRMSKHDELPPNQFAFGNLAPISVSGILRYEEVEKYHDLVSAMRRVIRKFDNDHDQEENIVRNNYVFSEDDMKRDLAIIGNPDIQHCHFTSGCRFPFHEVDYGWGKPLFVYTRALPIKNTVILMDAKCGDAIQALVSLVDEDMEMLPNELLSLENYDFSE